MSEQLDFEGSSVPTVGAELELQILDPETGDLAPGALRILDACQEEQIDGISGEFLLSMLEVKTDICQNARQVRDCLFPRLRRVRNIAASLGYELAIGGTHPFARPCMTAIYPDERYRKIQRKQGWMAYQEAVFGLHVHVGVPTGDAAIGVTNLLVEYLPHLLAIAANSPFWQGVDTNLASSRLRMFRPSGGAGMPPHFENWAAFTKFCRIMRDARALQSTKDMYWDIRPQPAYGTIEFRIFDAPTSLSALLGLTSLTRCLVIDALQQLKAHPEIAAGDDYTFWLANENRWLASRFGLQTRCTRQPSGQPDTLANDATRLVDRLLPLADSLDESQFLRSIYPVQFETGAERQRRIYREDGNWDRILDEMRNRWLQELDA